MKTAKYFMGNVNVLIKINIEENTSILVFLSDTNGIPSIFKCWCHWHEDKVNGTWSAVICPIRGPIHVNRLCLVSPLLRTGLWCRICTASIDHLRCQLSPCSMRWNLDICFTVYMNMCSRFVNLWEWMSESLCSYLIYFSCQI